MAAIVCICAIVANACSQETNVAFFLDASGSVGSTGWNQALQFTRNFVNETENNAIAIWRFAALVTPILPDFTKERGEIMKALDSTDPWQSDGSTNIVDSFLTFKNLTETSGPMIMVLVTDGEHTALTASGLQSKPDFAAANAKVTKEIRDQDRTIVVILVQDAITMRQEAITWTGKNETVIPVDNYAQLAEKVGTIISLSCIAIPLSILAILAAIAAALCCCVSSAAVAKKKFSEEEEGTLQQTFAPQGKKRTPQSPPSARRRALE